MSTRPVSVGVFAVVALGLMARLGSAQMGPGMPVAASFSAALAPAEMEGGAGVSGSAATDSEDSGLYANGTRAINDSRWAEAVKIFTKVAGEHGAHADGALYWKAYAENKQGQASHALDTCVELQRNFPSSSWKDECGALEIEIRAGSGKPVQPNAVQDEDLKLLALNSMMHQDEAKALAQIQEILKGDSNERLKERTVFILAQGQSNQARLLLMQVAQGQFNSGHSTPALQAKAAATLKGLKIDIPAAAYPGKSNGTMTLDVVVTDKSGAPVGGLLPGDFKLLDNKEPQTLVSVEAARGMTAKADPPVEAIVLIDGINSTFLTIANERQWLQKFLNENGGELALPTSLIVVTDQGMSVQNHPSRNGKALMDFLDNNATGFRAVRRAEGHEGVVERELASLKSLDFLASQAAARPGRKLLIWISPGWGLFSNELWTGGIKDENILFNYAVSLSTELRAARITLYSIDPAGEGHGQFLYQKYLKGVDSPKNADYADLLLQVLATQTGGQVLAGNNDLASLIDRCVADASSYYVLSYVPQAAAHPNEYHGVEVQVDRPGLTARNRTGYYAQPPAPGAQNLPSVAAQKPAN
jgi:VWFA-related protein